ncbi:aminopeptidase C [Bifidobacterium magnum]|uniref:Aminopeptidase n=1 Tax=Bifidobacterium magnum TaxID=1692 RepID=A0A087B833_9BIFI|nr:C1 family peptidase [Bifidobacterium magnum]KFI67183.1 Aminopeptidase C [Bifidobacterium magnum]
MTDRSATALNAKHLDECSAQFHHERANKVAENAATTNGVLKAATSFEGMRALPRKFDIELKVPSITNQRHSGRCWMFAGLNMLGYELIHAWNLTDFEFSETYLYFWETLEKANSYLEKVIATVDESTNDRLFQFINEAPGDDGGYWQLFADLVSKYGLMPKDAYPESANSMDSGAFKQYLGTKLRMFAADLREHHANGASEAELRAIKEDDMAVIYRMTCICLGEPPKTFDVLLRTEEKPEDTDGKSANADKPQHKLGEASNGTDKRQQIVEHGITPLEFVKKYVPVDVADFVTLCNSPMDSTPYNKPYVLEHSRDIAEADDYTFLNVDLETFRRAAVKQIKDGHPLYFCCDCEQFALRKEGYFSRNVVRVDELFGTSFDYSKAFGLQYCESVSNHAMEITGVELNEDGEPVRWKVENSWGKDNGDNGFYIGDAQWFDDFVNELVINKKYLEAATLEALNEQPVALQPWEPLSRSMRMR